MCLLLVIIFLLFCANDRASGAQKDARAHTILTDGITADAPGEDPAWLTLFADSSELPKTHYNVGEFAFWGLNAPHDASPVRAPQVHALLRDANIKGVRYDMIWGGIQQYGPDWYNYNWGGIEDDINQYVQDGFTICGLLSYTAYWSNGLRPRYFPPNQEIEHEVVTFHTNTAQLSHTAVIVTEPDWMPFVVTPENPTTVRVEDEIISTNFQRGNQPRGSLWPIVVGLEEVWVDENDGRGWVKWTRVEALIESPDGAEHYQVDRSGRIKFRDDAMFFHHGKTPAPGSRVKVSYTAITQKYENGVDFVFDHVNGVLTRMPGDISGHIDKEDFTEGPLDPRWTWQNPPANYDIGNIYAGHLRYLPTAPTSGLGHYLYQTISGSGDFSASLRVTNAPRTGNSQTGILVYQDDNNWFRIALSTNQGRPLLTRVINGVSSVYGLSGEIGWLVNPPRWVTVRKLGNSWTVLTSNSNPNAPDGGYQSAFTFQMELNFPMRVGISTVGTHTDEVLIDQFFIKSPAIPAGSNVAVYYTYLDTEPFQNFCRNWVSYYKDRIKYWEIYNEPDQWWCWRGGQDLYALFLRDASIAIKEADPDAIVVSGGYANGATGNLRHIYNTIGNSWFDVVAWHPYLFSNRSPDTNNWAYSSTNNQGRFIMSEFGDENKEVFFGELATGSGVLATGGGLNDHRQAEYGNRLFLWARRLGWVRAIQWWPALDLFEVGTGEDNKNGGHEGLFYKIGHVPKPVYYTYKNAATNRGVLLDLVGYDASNNPVPIQAKHILTGVTVGAEARQNISAVRVYTSVTGTSSQSRPPHVAARHIGQAGTAPFRVNVNVESPELKLEKWTVTALDQNTFQVSAAISGPQGIATVGVPFTSDNGTVQFTLPAGSKPYIVGDHFLFETFVGDDYVLAGEWVNDGSTGHGDIHIPFSQPVEGRYVAIHFDRAPYKESIRIDEVKIWNNSGVNVALGQLYIVDGYQEEFKQEIAPPTVSVSEAKTLEDGTFIQLEAKVLYKVSNQGFGYVSEPDRSSGIRLESLPSAEQDSLVTVRGLTMTTDTGERAIQVISLQVVGSGTVNPLVTNTRDMQQPLLDGLLVNGFGVVKPGSIQGNSFILNDGAGAGVRVFVKDISRFEEGQFVRVQGAAGRNGSRVIYER